MFRKTLIALLFAVMSFGSAAEVHDVRVVGNGSPTRVTIWSDTPQDARVYLTEQGESRALVLPLSGAVSASTGEGMGGVDTWAISEDRLDVLLDRPMMVVRSLSLPPAGSEPLHRVVIDLETVAPVRFSKAARKDMKRLTRAIEDAKAPQVMAQAPAAKGRYTIVIDAGHGGKDPGAIAVTGAYEKTITLSAAKELKTLLEADRRYHVRLTREGDTYLPLEDRVTLARNWNADLFISLHADAAGKSTVAGASVYTISDRGVSRIDKEASKNNWKIPVEDGTSEEVNGILESLIKRETQTNSAVFAEMLVPELAKAGPVLRTTHKEAGFYVLLAPDVPAVLLELGFLTNRDDAKRLMSKSGQRKSVEAVKRGIDRFFAEREQKFAGN